MSRRRARTRHKRPTHTLRETRSLAADALAPIFDACLARPLHTAIWLADLTDDVASWASDRDLEILVGHYKWEMECQQEAHGMKLVPESLVTETFPTGRQFIFWCSAPVGDLEVPEPEVRRADASENSPDYLPAAPFLGNASIRNGCELVLFGIQGLGTLSTPESVTIKATRIAFLAFFE